MTLNTLYGLYWLVANLCDGGPLLLVVDDAHWSDVASLRFLAFLAPRLVELPVLLLICARPDEWEPEALFAGTASDVAMRPLVPAPLSGEACAVLVRTRFDESADVAYCAACQTVTGGNPFLLRALLDELTDGRVSPRAESAGVVLAMGPRVVTRSIVARLGTLSAAARPVAAALAVLGDGASVEELAALAGLSAGEVRRVAGELAGVSILAAQEEFGFAHAIVRNAVYRDLGPDERDRLHRQAAQLLEAAGAPAELVAEHLLAIDPAGQVQVCATLRRAVETARVSGASHSAVAYLRRALAEPCPEGERAELLVQLGAAERLADGRTALAHLRQALDLTTDPCPYVEIVTQVAWLLTFAGLTEEAVATAERALAQLGDRDRDLRRRLEATFLVAGDHGLIRVRVDALTASERRVARTAAEGMSNKQIAQALFVTVKTVETHLYRTYQKLDVSSRAQLAQALEPAP